MLTLNSYAKINRYLEVESPPRPDGFHNLRTVFQEITLHDTLHFSAECPQFAIEGIPDVPTEDNLIFRAWQILRSEFGPQRVRPLHVTVEKRIPAGGGLGGGSSNAAACLRAVNTMFDLGLDNRQLIQRAAALGSDCAFFVLGGTALATGRGEILTPIPDVPPQPILLHFPTEKVPTGPAFRALDTMVPRPKPQQSAYDMARLLQCGTPQEIADAMHNDFELTVCETPWYRQACDELRRRGGTRPMLSGSGSTVFSPAAEGIAPDAMTR